MNDVEAVKGKLENKETFTFFYVGHAYGAHKHKEYWKRHSVAYPPPNLVRNIEHLASHDIGVFGGDVVERCAEKSITALEKTLIEPLAIPLLNSTGNHDSCLSARYNYPRQLSFVASGYKFIVLSSADRDMSREDQDWIAREISLAANDFAVDGLFVFTHRPTFLQLVPDSARKMKQANMAVSHDDYFLKTYEPLLSAQSMSKPLFWFAGDMGVRKPILYEHLKENVHLIASGIYERDNDRYLSVKVSSGGVDISVHYLNRDFGYELEVSSVLPEVYSPEAIRKIGSRDLQNLITDLYVKSGVHQGKSIDSILVEGEPIGLFDPFYSESHNQLVLRNTDCGQTGENKFFVQFFPSKAEDRQVSIHQAWNGYHFHAKRLKTQLDTCIAFVPIPDYPIDRIRTGQLGEGNKILWKLELAPPI